MNESMDQLLDGSLKLGNRLILSLQATGGFKYREKLPGSNQDKDERCRMAVSLTYELCIRVAILENMIKYNSYVDREYSIYTSKMDEARALLETRKKGERKHG